MRELGVGGTTHERTDVGIGGGGDGGGTKRKDGGMTWAGGGRKAKADLLPHPPHPRPRGPNWMRSGHLATLWRN